VREWDKRTYEFWTGLLWGNEKISPVVVRESGGDSELEKARERMRVVGLGEKESRNYWAEVTPPLRLKTPIYRFDPSL
jgi:hypothetical protein